jgi:hypothetical protein
MMGAPYPLECGWCGERRQVDISDASLQVACPACESPTQVRLFPAFRRRIAVEQGEAVRSEEESSCYFHPEKRAASPCSACGRYLCALCAVELEGQPICANCMDQHLKPDQAGGLYYDSLALLVALVGALIFYLIIFTGPTVLYLSIRYWRTPQSVAPRNRWRFVVASLIVVVESLALMGVLGIILMEVMAS